MKYLIFFLCLNVIIISCKDEARNSGFSSKTSLNDSTFSIEERTRLFLRLLTHPAHYELSSDSSTRQKTLKLIFPFTASLIDKHLDSLSGLCIDYAPVITNFIFEDSFELFNEVEFCIKAKDSGTTYVMNETAEDMQYYCRPMKSDDKLNILLRILHCPYTYEFKDSMISVSLKTNYPGNMALGKYFETLCFEYSGLIYAYITSKDKVYNKLEFKIENTDEWGEERQFVIYADSKAMNLKNVKRRLLPNPGHSNADDVIHLYYERREKK